VDEFDELGWSPLHHALNCCSYSSRAANAADWLVTVTPPSVINSRITGEKALGSTCLHLASEGSDVRYRRAHFVTQLVQRGANLEAKTGIGNTALLLASSTGVSDVVQTLLWLGADPNATNNRGFGVWQGASQCSLNTRKHVPGGSCRDVAWVPPSSQRNGTSESRICRKVQQDWGIADSSIAWKDRDRWYGKWWEHNTEWEWR